MPRSCPELELPDGTVVGTIDELRAALPGVEVALLVEPDTLVAHEPAGCLCAVDLVDLARALDCDWCVDAWGDWSFRPR